MAGDAEYIDKGWNRIQEQLAIYRKAFTKIGVLSSEDAGLRIIATAHEFGAMAGRGRKVKIPQRSFLGSTYDEEKEKVWRMIEENYGKVLEGSMDARTAISQIGEYFKGRVQRKIVTLKIPGNAASTIKRKKNVDNPLIDKGVLVNGIQHEENYGGLL